MGKNVSSALAALIENVAEAKAAGAYASTLSLAKAAKKDEKTVRRMINGENEPALDTVSAIARALSMEPWELIRPASERLATPSVQDSLAVLVGALAQLSPDQQREAADLLQRMALVPDGQAPRTRLEALLTGRGESGGGVQQQPRAA